MGRLGTEITSFQNPKIKEVSRLRQERQRKKASKILVDGSREIAKAMHAGFCPDSLFLDAAKDLGDELEELLSSVQARSLFHLPSALFEKIAYGDRNEGIVAVFEEERKSLTQLQLGPNSLLLVLDGIEKPGNVGAVFRSASAAGVDAIVLTNEICSPFNANAIRASLGTVFELPFASADLVDATEFFASKGIDVVTTRVDATLDYTEFDFTGALAIVMGSEALGISDQWNTFQSVKIPMQRAVDSLNISVSAAVVAFEARRQRRSGSKN